MATAVELNGRQAALDNLRRALDYYVGTTDVPRAMAVATPSFVIPGLSGVIEFITRALDVAPSDSHDAGMLLSRLGGLKFHKFGDDEGAQDALRKAMSIAQRENDIALEALTLARLSNIDLSHLRYEQSMERSARAVELAQQAGDQYSERHASFIAARSSLVMGNTQGLAQYATTLLTVSERLREPIWLSWALTWNGRANEFESNWDEARDFYDRSLALVPKHWSTLGSRALMEHQVGEFSQGEMYLESLLADMRVNPAGGALDPASPIVVISLVARITGVLDWFDVAESTAETVLSSPSVTPLDTVLARAGLALMAVQRGDAEAAEEQYAALESQRGRMLGVSIDRLLGLVAQTMGNLGDAQTHFEEATAFCRKANYRPELAWSLHDYADMLLERDGEGDNAKATSLLDESLRISTDLGMRPLMERVLSKRDILKA